MGESKFYCFRQNNPDGFFDVDENVSPLTIIEALDENHAVELLEPLIEYQKVSRNSYDARWSLMNMKIIELPYVGKIEYAKDSFFDVTKLWYEECGDFTTKDEPKWKTEYGMDYFGAEIICNTIEDYCKCLLIRNYYHTTHNPFIIVHFLNGMRKQFSYIKPT